MTVPAAIFEAASPRRQEGRPSQPVAGLLEDFVMTERLGGPDCSGSAGISSAPPEAHRAETPATEHGAIRGNPAGGFTYADRYRQGTAWHRMARKGEAGLGTAGRGVAGHGPARLGAAWIFSPPPPSQRPSAPVRHDAAMTP